MINNENFKNSLEKFLIKKTISNFGIESFKIKKIGIKEIQDYNYDKNAYKLFIEISINDQFIKKFQFYLPKEIVIDSILYNKNISEKYKATNILFNNIEKSIHNYLKSDNFKKEMLYSII